MCSKCNQFSEPITDHLNRDVSIYRIDLDYDFFLNPLVLEGDRADVTTKAFSRILFFKFLWEGRIFTFKKVFLFALQSH